MEGRSVLLVSYHFPPMGGSGVQRALKLAKYLPACGWSVRVLCAGHDHYPLRDETLLDELDPETIIDRVSGWEPGALAARLARFASPVIRNPRGLKAMEDRAYWRLASAAAILGLPETEQLWKSAALRHARQLADRGELAAVITTSPPLTTHEIGHALKREYGIPWIADLRDPITDNFAYSPKNDREDAFCRRVERMAVEDSDACVVTCPEFATRLRERFALSSPDQIEVITNGFDRADAPHGELASDAKAAARFELLYVGAFYREQTIEPMLEAMRTLLIESPQLKGRISLRVVGSVSATQRALIAPTDSAFLELAGYQPHAQAIAAMRKADAVVLMTPGNDGGRLCVPAKAYEYMAFGPHILAITHRETAMERWLQAAGNVTCVRHRVRAGTLARAILDCYEKWQRGVLQTPRNEEVVARFSREAVARQYAELLSSLVLAEVACEPSVCVAGEAFV